MNLKKFNINPKNKFIHVITIFVLCAGIVFPQTFKKTATAGFTFLEIPATSRTAALGEATLALSDVNSAAVFINPGALGFASLTHSFTISYSPWFADIKNYATSYAFKTDFGVLGVGLIMLDYGSMPRTIVAQGQKVYSVIGSFDANSLALGLTYSKMLTDHFSFGVTIKYAQEKIDVYKASNLLFDGGVLYYTGLGSLRIAASIQNFGVNAKFINDEFKMPSVLKLGAAMEVLGNMNSTYRITLLAEALHPNDGNERVNVGGEFSWQNILTLRAGYKFFTDEESYTLGFGVDPQLTVPVSFDFAFSDYGRLGNISRLTLLLGIN